VGCAAINSEKIDIIEMCESRGKHVMVDKPAVVNRDGLERLQAIVERGRIEVGILLTERFRSSIYTLKGMIDRGDLGRLVGISMRKPHRLSESSRPAWHFSKSQNGGILIDLMIHDFDLVRWLTGQKLAVSHAVMTKNMLPEYPDFYDTAVLQGVTSESVAVQLYSDWHTPNRSWTWGDCRIFVTGTEGSAELRLEGDPFVGSKESLLT